MLAGSLRGLSAGGQGWWALAQARLSLCMAGGLAGEFPVGVALTCRSCGGGGAQSSSR